jgi:class 3 adenylate cyclase/CHASE2 domain-containing sensor protein
MDATRRSAIAALVIAALTAGLLATPPFARLRGLSIDLLHGLRGRISGPAAPDLSSPVVVLAVDEETYRQPPFADIPQALWMKQLATVINGVNGAGAAVMGFDIVFPTSPANVGEDLKDGFDRPYLQALARMGRPGRLVLGKVQHQKEPVAPYPGQRVAVGAGNVRSLNVFNDADDVIRRIPLLFEGDGEQEPSFALELAKRAAKADLSRSADGVRLGDWLIPGSAGNTMPVAFAPPGRIPAYNIADIHKCLEDGKTGFMKEQFAGKVVIVGLSLSLEDRKLTSLRWSTPPEGPTNGPRCALPAMRDLFYDNVTRDEIPGVYIHANAVDNLLRRAPLRELPGWSAPLFDLVFALGGAALAVFLGPLLALAGVIGGVAVWTGVAYGAFTTQLILPVAVPALAGLIGLGATMGWRFVVADKDKRALRSSFSLYLPAALVDRMLDQPPELGGEEREVTVFFSDLAGFSTMTEAMAPAEVVALMNRYLTAMTDEIERHGGMVDKYIGDAIVALFGAPLDDPDHARHAAQAALACEAQLVALNRELEAEGRKRVGQRIGLNSGRALVGNIGSRRRFNYTAMGDTVNLASRLEGANKQYGTAILASEAVVQAANGLNWRELDTVRVVGRNQPVTVYTLLPEGAVAPAAYQEALAAWRAGDFAAAAARLAPLEGVDPAAGKLRKRALAMAERGAPAGWAGVTALDEK